jgi:hypothetical protein
MLARRRAEQAVLTDSWFVVVYDAVSQARSIVEDHLRNTERNPILKTLPDDTVSLDFLYSRIDYVLSHPARALWWLFWADLWESNKDLSRVRALESILDPLQPTSLAYHPLERSKLEPFLDKHAPLLRSQYFFISNAVLDALYAELDARTAFLVDQDDDTGDKSILE